MKMVEIKIDIAGKVCPFCLLIVKKQLAKLAKEDPFLSQNMIIHAATDTIPYAMKKAGHQCETLEISPGVWEIKIIKK